MLQASLADLNVVDFVFADPMLHSSGLDVSREEIVTQLSAVGFTQEMLEMVITSLSGGWKMKLALARAMLMKVRLKYLKLVGYRKLHRDPMSCTSSLICFIIRLVRNPIHVDVAG